jgi:hypothetical protein
MSRFHRRVFPGLALGALVALCACVAIQDTRKKDAGGGGGGGSGGAADARAGTPDVQAAPQTCREIRNCRFDCGEDPDCAARCFSAAPGVARAQFSEAQMCSAQVCPTQDTECRCAEECFTGGNCQQIVDECDEASSDKFCDGPCH